ncbi:MAG: ABC transporter substrate-binding protein [Dethiosulfatibacter sp.]|nr:ABC transporter substrate-binding protein [Dethiosulfatibacter sp.]
MKKKSICIISLILIAMMLFTGCGQAGGNDVTTTGNSATPTESETEAVAKRTDLNLGAIGEPKTLDPTQISDLVVFYVTHQIYNHLIDNRTDGNLVPGVAESWTYSDDGTEITFKLRQGVKFHNGDTMTADDVVYSFETAIASAFTKGVTAVMDSVSKVDENTVVLKLKHSYGPIEYCVASSQIPILNKKAHEADPEGYARSPIGTGPYKFVEWKSGDKIILTAFDDYYKGAPAIKDVTFKIIIDGSTAVVALENGEIDIIDTPPKTDRQNLIDNPDIAYYETEIASTVFMAINHNSELFSNKKLREAVSYAIDKESLIIGAVEGIGTALETPMAKSTFGWPEDFKNKQYDVEKAKQLLIEAGYPDGLDIVLKTNESATYFKPTEVIQDQLRQIGINASISKMERGAFWDDILTKRDYDIVVSAATATYPDADYIYSTFHSRMVTEGRNYFNYSNPVLDDLLERGRLSNDQEERKQIYREICELFEEDVISIPLYTYMTPIAANKDLKGVMAHPTNRMFVEDYSW